MIASLHPLPKTANSSAFEHWLAELSKDQIKAVEPALKTLVPLFSSAPYLLDLARNHQDFLCAALYNPVDQTIEKIQQSLTIPTAAELDEQTLSKILRDAKGQTALIVAIAETGKIWPPKQAAIALSNLADACLQAALNFLVAEAQTRGKFVSETPLTADNCGLCVLALGKHGGLELNYSSDIDVVTFFDPNFGLLADPHDASKTYSRIVQRLATLMQERNEHGYVFRTDLRLRPDPGSTPVAISVDAALTYYEGRGQNWERAAWIKARPAAGDKSVALNFLNELKPFIWRKHLDFAAIADIQAMKRQINISQDVGKERLAGHNVKLGRGGIREVEFFAQTQQLIAGGREANLRVIPTTDALAELANNKWISQQTADEMSGAYWFLRAVENRVQMLNDEQTHILPENLEALAAISRMMGYENLSQFETAYRANLQIVTDNYTNLFVDKNALSAQSGSLVFTGTDDDPATLETLTSLGFDAPKIASATIRKWHYGGYAATRAAASRAHLTELIPVLLQTIARAGNADKALLRFDNFLSKLPAGVQLFAMLRSQDQLCQLLVAFMASAPKMAESVIRRAHVLDGLIDPSRSGEVSDPITLENKINAFLAEANGFEDIIDRARILGQEQKFLISAGLISGVISPKRAAKQFSLLAQTLLDRLFEHVRQQFEVRHGKIKNAKIALLAFGKLGSQEMSVVSDLDVILLFDVPPDAELSDGEKPLNVSLYFTRLTQRLISALSAQTAEGILYELDMRLRPSGNAGPLATSLAAFTAYQLDKAWTWEHQALTRARVVFADQGFSKKIDSSINQILNQTPDPQKILTDVSDMRARLLADRPARHSLDLKLVEGGVMDIEFIAQSAVLLHADLLKDHRRETGQVLMLLQANNLLPQGEELAQIHSLMSSIMQISTACLIKPSDFNFWSVAFKALLARLTNYPDFQRLEQDISDMKQTVLEANKHWNSQ